VESQLVLDLLRVELLVTSEYEALRAVSEAQLVDLHHFAVCDESDHGILGDEVDALLEGVLELDQLLRSDCRVNDKHENGSCVLRLVLGRWQHILESGIVLHELEGQGGLGDVVGIVLGEVVGRQTDGALPRFELEVDRAVGVQHALALFAGHGWVLDGSSTLDFFQGRVQSANGEDDSCCTNFGVGPVVPGEPDAILHFSLVEVHLSLLD